MACSCVEIEGEEYISEKMMAHLNFCLVHSAAGHIKCRLIERTTNQVQICQCQDIMENCYGESTRDMTFAERESIRQCIIVRQIDPSIQCHVNWKKFTQHWKKHNLYIFEEFIPIKRSRL